MIPRLSTFLFMTVAWLASAYGQTTPQPIPAGFDFPANEQTLLQFRDQKNVAEMRRHVWKVFAGITQPTASGEAIWETWYSSDETFGAVQPQALGARKAQRRFQAPRQFLGSGLTPQAVGESLASFTLFNEDLRTFVRQKKLYQKATLAPSISPLAPRFPWKSARFHHSPRRQWR